MYVPWNSWYFNGIRRGRPAKESTISPWWVGMGIWRRSSASCRPPAFPSQAIFCPAKAHGFYQKILRVFLNLLFCFCLKTGQGSDHQTSIWAKCCRSKTQGSPRVSSGRPGPSLVTEPSPASYLSPQGILVPDSMTWSTLNQERIPVVSKHVVGTEWIWVQDTNYRRKDTISGGHGTDWGPASSFHLVIFTVCTHNRSQEKWKYFT